MLRRQCIGIAVLTLCLGVAILVTSLTLRETGPRSLKISAQSGGYLIDFAEFGLAYRYACLSSAEYGRPYLPIEFDCNDCQIDSASQEILDQGWNPAAVLVVVRTNDTFEVMHQPIKDFDLMEVETYTSYRNSSFFPERYAPLAQCIRARSATASCAKLLGKCLVLFKQ